MKRFTVLFYLFIFSSTVYAQKIKTDRIESSGIRLIETTDKSVGGPGLSNYIGFSLSVLSNSDSTSWYLDLKVEDCLPIPSGSALLIKLQNDSIITLVSSSEAIATAGSIPLALATGQVIGISYNTAYAKYPLTISDLQCLLNTKIVKIRIETPEEVYDRKIKENVNKYLPKMFDLISNRLKQNNSQTIYDNF